jgi:hypothetical protein
MSASSANPYGGAPLGLSAASCIARNEQFRESCGVMVGPPDDRDSAERAPLTRRCRGTRTASLRQNTWAVTRSNPRAACQAAPGRQPIGCPMGRSGEANQIQD